MSSYSDDLERMAADADRYPSTCEHGNEQGRCGECDNEPRVD